jgi:choline dehydrogenase-like flavoprotein
VLLMLSGIGPEDQLTPLGIEIREALPVGEGLQDHCMAQVNYLTDEPSLFMAATPENFALLESEGRGPLSSNIPEAAGFFRTRPGLQAPDIEFHFAPRPRLLLRPGGDHPEQPRTGDAAGAAARLQAPDPVQLPDHRGGPPEHDCGAADGA